MRTEGVDRQVRIRVASTSFDFVDGNIRGPIPVELPHTPGSDVAGDQG
ncbi:NADPH:quinone reductase-like Zn-dependent oxidoreductase [Streptomyces sp. SAI-133]|nr:hypothetical protein [Streptomyces sp. SAI-133]MDH6589607.1 NADPH:quinone reductase-like Zn-dependent oxidoreductase [Streptomyces sp. SAI-133]